MLWAISSPSTLKDSYLFGTMHLVKADFYPYLEWIKTYADNCSSLALEIAIPETSIYGNLGIMDLLSDGFSLKAHYSNAKWRKLSSRSKRFYNISLEQFNHLPPFVLSQMLQRQLLSHSFSIEPDKWLWENSLPEKIKFGLEEIEDNLQLIASVPIKAQLQHLNQLLLSPGAFKKSMTKLERNYQKGALQSIHRSVKSQSGVLRKSFIYRRNHTMSVKMIDKMTRNSVFAAVGAGHLWGGKGMLRILKKKGFKVVPVKWPDLT